MSQRSSGIIKIINFFLKKCRLWFYFDAYIVVALIMRRRQSYYMLLSVCFATLHIAWPRVYYCSTIFCVQASHKLNCMAKTVKNISTIASYLNCIINFNWWNSELNTPVSKSQKTKKTWKEQLLYEISRKS